MTVHFIDGLIGNFCIAVLVFFYIQYTAHVWSGCAFTPNNVKEGLRIALPNLINPIIFCIAMVVGALIRSTSFTF